MSQSEARRPFGPQFSVFLIVFVGGSAVSMIEPELVFKYSKETSCTRKINLLLAPVEPVTTVLFPPVCAWGW
jgi:hypothetical protein